KYFFSSKDAKTQIKITTMEEVKQKLERIDEILASFEDTMHGDESKECFEARCLVIDLQKSLKERFTMPTDEQLIEIAILFNDGRVDTDELSKMVAMAQLVLHRLHEHNDITKKSKL